MKIYFKYLIIGWSIVSIALVVLSYQIMKKEFVEEKYLIPLPSFDEIIQPVKEGEREDIVFANKIRNAALLSLVEDCYIDGEIVLTSESIIGLFKEAKKIHIESQHTIEPVIYLRFPIYAFLIWAVPIIVFSLLGIVFGKK